MTTTADTGPLVLFGYSEEIVHSIVVPVCWAGTGIEVDTQVGKGTTFTVTLPRIGEIGRRDRPGTRPPPKA